MQLLGVTLLLSASALPRLATAEITLDLYGALPLSSGAEEDSPRLGARATWWQNARTGFALDFGRSDDDDPRLSFAGDGDDDRLDVLTVNYMVRWPEAWGGATPYLGAGLGIAMPRIEVTPGAGAESTGTAPAGRLVAGARYQFSDRWSAFGEYQFSATGDLDEDGASDAPRTDSSVNFGVGFSF